MAYKAPINYAFIVSFFVYPSSLSLQIAVMRVAFCWNGQLPLSFSFVYSQVNGIFFVTTTVLVEE